MRHRRTKAQVTSPWQVCALLLGVGPDSRLPARADRPRKRENFFLRALACGTACRGLEYVDKAGVRHAAIEHWTFIAADGVEMPLEEGTSAFITMNPGYIGRAELPESLKALFRPITVVVPDRQLIMENMLMAEVRFHCITNSHCFTIFLNLAHDCRCGGEGAVFLDKSLLLYAAGFCGGKNAGQEVCQLILPAGGSSVPTKAL